MSVYFHYLGKHSFFKWFIKRIVIGFEIEKAHISIIQTDISSFPWVLFGSNDIIIVTISSNPFQKYKSFVGLESYILGDRTIVAYCCALLTELITKQTIKNQSQHDYLLAKQVSVES